MKLEHTPRPWFVLKDAFEWNICHKPKVLQGTPAGYPVARCPTSIKNAEANARLIAAAPEMLEALIKVYDNRGEEDKLYLQAERLRPIIEDATGKTWEELTNCTS